MMLHDTDWASLVIKMDRRKGEGERGRNIEGDTQASNSFSSLPMKKD